MVQSKTVQTGASSGDQTRCDPGVTRSRAEVVFMPGERPSVEETSERLFGRKLAGWQYAALAGAPDDALVEVGTDAGGLYIEISQTAAGSYCGVFLLHRTKGQLVVSNDALRIHRQSMQRRGLGLRIFARQLDGAIALGVGRIETVAGRRESENGYYTWPRFGFDGWLPLAMRLILPSGLEEARTVLDLMELEVGRRWWKQHGVTLKVVFDTRPRSRSRRAFERYLLSKLGPRGKRVPLQPSEANGKIGKWARAAGKCHLHQHMQSQQSAFTRPLLSPSLRL